MNKHAMRKAIPLASGCFDYFPNALQEVAKLSKLANDQHNPGQPMHWAFDKSTDHDECLARHFLERDDIDDDGIQHDVKVAWRALARIEARLLKAGAKPGKSVVFSKPIPDLPLIIDLEPVDEPSICWRCGTPSIAMDVLCPTCERETRETDTP